MKSMGRKRRDVAGGAIAGIVVAAAVVACTRVSPDRTPDKVAAAGQTPATSAVPAASAAAAPSGAPAGGSDPRAEASAKTAGAEAGKKDQGNVRQADLKLAPPASALGGVVGGVVGGILGVVHSAAPPPLTACGYFAKEALQDRDVRNGPTLAREEADALHSLGDVAAEPDQGLHTESYAAIDESPFLEAASNPLSTFSIDVDRASYSNVRRYLADGQRPPVDAVRIEELINYFPYDDPAPTGSDPIAVRAELGQAPWNPLHRLLRIGLQARRIDLRDLPPNNLVFLIDVSGSMQTPEKLPLLKSAFRLLVNELREEDRVALVVYAGNAGLVLPSTPGSHKQEILDAIDTLEAGGSTAGGQGIRLAYDVARANRIANGNNRVILATDGDFNVGASSDAEMFRLVEERRAEGTFLTVLGFGRENLKDSKMEGMADRGNGQYAYVDSLLEARKVLVRELGGTLATVAKDVKLQVEFNPAEVAAYRLIGYENRLLWKEDFDDDTKDAGEMGAGHTVTALYEILPVGITPDVDLRRTGPLRYQPPAGAATAAGAGAESASPAVTETARPGAGASRGEIAFVKIRYKEPAGDGASRLIEQAVRSGEGGAPSADFTFAAAVAEFGLVLRESKYRGQGTLEQVLSLARGSLGRDEEGYRHDFVEMAGQAIPLVKPAAIAAERQ